MVTENKNIQNLINIVEGVKTVLNLKDFEKKVENLVSGVVNDTVKQYKELVNRQDELKQSYKKLYESQLTYVSNLSVVYGQDALQINDLIFGLPPMLTPPTVIRVDKQVINYKWQTLRNEPQKVSSGHSNARISLSLYFVGLDSINTGLGRLLATFKALPFVYVENSFLRNNLLPSNSGSRIENMAFSLVGMSVQTVPGLPNVLVANLDMLWFNYHPYATNFVFRQKWGNVLDSNTTKNETTIDKTSSNAEGVKINSSYDNQVKNPTNKNEPGIAYTQPTLLPQNSEPLMVYVDSYVGPKMDSMNNYIQLTYREYDSIAGFKEATNIVSGFMNNNLIRSVKQENIKPNQGVIIKMHPDAADALEILGSKFKNKFKISIPVSDCFRTREQTIYLQKTRPDVAPKGYSWHEVGLSIDIATSVLNREQYQFLLNEGERLGFYNLGKTYGYGPSFANDSATAMVVAPSNTRDDKGRLSNWEGWHFDYRPAIISITKQYGPNVQTAIQTYRSMLLFSTSKLTDTEILSTIGENTSIKEIQEKDSDAEKKISILLGDKIKDGWQIDAMASDPIRILLYKNRSLIVEDNDTQLIPQSVAFSQQNIITEIPIIGHEFSTQQYLGPADTDAVVSFVANGEDKLRLLQEVLTTVQKNARICKGVRDAAVIDIKNSVLNFGGITEVMVDAISAQSIEGMPGCSSVNLQLTKASRRQDKFLKQEKFLSSHIWREITTHVYSKLLKQKIENELNIAAYAWEYNNIKDNMVSEISETGGSVNFSDVTKQVERTLSTPGVDGRGYTSYIIDLFENNYQSKIFDSNESTYTENWIKDSQGEFVKSGYLIPIRKIKDDTLATVLYKYGDILVGLIDGVISPMEMSVLGIPDNIIQQILKVRQLNPTSIQTNVANQGKNQLFNSTRASLTQLWVDIYKDQLYLDPVFSDLYQRIYDIMKQFKHGNPCYPDLNLPPHPLSNDVLDTPADFWFWNESVDGAHFLDTGNETILQQAKDVMSNTYESMKKLTSKEEYEKNYVSYNKSELDKRNIGELSSDQGKIATISYDEHGFKSDTNYELTVNKDNKIMELLMKPIGSDKLKLSSTPASFKEGDKIKFGRFKKGELEKEILDEDETIINGSSSRLSQILEQSVRNLDTDVFNLARAFPTFKIYFIEEDLENGDSGRLGIRNFDDFYSYSAIKDIRIVKNRKLPADLCVISITNISGELDTLMYTSDGLDGTSYKITEKFNPLTVNTDRENPFSKLVLMEGNKVQVKLGYSNDPDGLENVFIGQIVEVGVSPISPDIIQLVCQSYGVELVSELKTGGSFNDTQSLLSSLICSGECKHFGKWDPLATYDPDSIRTAYGKDTRAGTLFLNQLINSLKDSTLTHWNFLNKPQDDNIFAPGIQSYTTNKDGFLDYMDVVLGIGHGLEAIKLVNDDRVYWPWHSTIWDIFQEMELRHPGYVSLAVPYEDRYTMFFGPPSHCYWSRPLSMIEEAGWKKYQSVMDKVKDMRLDVSMSKIDSLFTEQDANDYNELIKLLLINRESRYKPFRNYFFLSSNHNIIANNISVSSHNTFNAINLTYMRDAVKLKSEFGTMDNPEEQEQGVAAANAKAISQQSEILQLKADDNIEDRYTRVMSAMYVTCFGEYFARRYAVSLLMKSLRDVYKGEIVITGTPKAKPYDVCMIYDTYRDIYGPVEIKQVTHIFSQETGFITTIQPDMIISHNAWTTQCTGDAMLSVGANLYNSMMDRFEGLDVPERSTAQTLGAVATWAGTGLLTGGVGFGLIALGGYKILNWSQGRHPILITPLCHGPKPWFAGVDGYKHDTLITNTEGRWKRFKDNVGEGFNDFYERSTITKAFQEMFSNIID